MSIYYSDDHVTLHHGDCLDVLAELPDASVDCIVTSPPYYGLRDYGVAGQHGAESSPAEYVETLRAVFAESRRVLADVGTLWLNLGDSYSAPAGQGNKGVTSGIQGGVRPSGRRDRSTTPAPSRASFDRPAKNLLGIPWRVAIALQDDGWILRNDIIWAKPNAMPESVADRVSTKHEHLFMFAKSPRYWFDLDSIREPHVSEPGREGANCLRGQKATRPVGPNSGAYSDGGRNPGDVWTIPTQPFTEAHFAVMAPELARRAIAAGCKPGGVVLDPYSGSGTTGQQALRLGRRYVGIELNADYLDLSLSTRFRETPLNFGEAS